MQIAYCLYSCNSDGDINSSLLITPDFTKVIYSERELIRLPYNKSVSLEVRSKREVMGVLAKLMALGFGVTSYKEALQYWDSQRLLIGAGSSNKSLIMCLK